MKPPAGYNLLYSCLGLSFILLFIGFLFAGLVRPKEPFDISSCYYDYLKTVLRFPDINPFYYKGRKWRYYGFETKL